MPYIKPDGIEEVWARELARSREIFQEEMRNVLSCQTKTDRKQLFEKWKVTYTEGMVKDLVKCAQDKTYRVMVANNSKEKNE